MSASAEVATKATSTDTAAAVRALRGAASHVERTIARALEPFGLTTAQFSTLQVLLAAETESLGCSEIAQRLGGPGPDVTRLIDRLEAAGLVSRDRSQIDRRLVHARITVAGRKAVDDAAPSVNQAEEQAMSSLAATERLALARLLASVQKSCPGHG
ncbi:MAG: MarR family transcriptional regulator [Gemmatimonas sp.]